MWLIGRWRDGPIRGQDRLFPYVLLKAFLSSRDALAATVKARLGKATGREHEALLRLRDLAKEMTDDDSAKLAALVAQLRAIGIGPRSATRAVVFTESVPTLRWLAAVLPGRLGLRDSHLRMLYGGISDKDQQQIVEEFGLAGSDVRLLVTTDVASEGVNLHRQCHQIVHFDIPWSLIRIEQRNGRIDRYGQQHSPQFRALVLVSQVPGAKDDRDVAEKVLRREEAMHRSLGSVGAATGLVDATVEEERHTRDLLEGRPVEDSFAPAEDPDVLADLLAGAGAPAVPDVPRARTPRLFASTQAFVDAALGELFDDRPEDALDLRREDGLLSFLASDDLVHRLVDLPRSYLAAHREGERLRLKVTFDRALAQRKLDEAHRSKTTMWPEIAYLSDVHPVVDWLVDKVLARLGKQEAPVLVARVPEPVFLVQGVYCNRLGRPTVVEWAAVSGLPDAPVLAGLDETLAAAGVGPDMVNRAEDVPLELLQELVPEAVAAAREHLATRRAEWDERVAEPIRAYRERLRRFEQASLFDVGAVVTEQTDLMARLATSGEPMLRVLAVLVGGRS